MQLISVANLGFIGANYIPWWSMASLVLVLALLWLVYHKMSARCGIITTYVLTQSVANLRFGTTIHRHRLREAGVDSKLIGELDQRCFTIKEIHQFYKEFTTERRWTCLIHEVGIHILVVWLMSWVLNMKEQVNPLKRKEIPWIYLKDVL